MRTIHKPAGTTVKPLHQKEGSASRVIEEIRKGYFENQEALSSTIAFARKAGKSIMQARAMEEAANRSFEIQRIEARQIDAFFTGLLGKTGRFQHWRDAQTGQTLYQIHDASGKVEESGTVHVDRKTGIITKTGDRANTSGK